MTSVPGFGARREAREDALAVLYEAEIAGGSSQEALARRAVPPSDYAVAIVLGVDADRENLNSLLRRHLVRWRLERLAVVDRALARIAAWELSHRGDVPTGVVLSEAVALATQYCGGDSPRFLNGVLRAVADEVRGPAGEASGSAVEVSGSVDEVHGPADGVSGFAGEARGPADETRGSVVEVRGPADETRGSVVEVSGPADEVRGPAGDEPAGSAP